MSYFDEPEPVKKSKGTSIFLWVFGIFGALIVLGCGGIILTVFLFFRKTVSQNPVKVRAVAEEITEIQLPERFQPQWTFSAFGMKMAFFSGKETAGQSSMLALMELPTEAAQDPEQMRESMRQGFQGQGGQIPNLETEETEERTYTIRGEEQTVTIQRGRGQDAKEWVQVLAPFTSKQGKPALLSLTVPKDSWDEAEFEAVLESMQ